ncbi:hypothetical protein Enr13x_37640 [Stieleria neptunia]|uniref:Uncharacterized protein n=1 Tax=Stieleria neptunia TaxID=2527979 RepID=A0A518HSW9_9BACT|nr:hypothetical protein [Stieleria neptunia]QDV43904.1 hypothetical protein Enr13x_37640 [Stieleria neptunia]
MAKKASSFARRNMQGLTKSGTYRFSPDIALELAVYGKVGKFGSQKSIIEQSLEEFFSKNPLPKKLRDAALVLIDEA